MKKIRRHDTIPQELDDPEDVLVTADSFVSDSDDDDNDDNDNDNDESTRISFPRHKGHQQQLQQQEEGPPLLRHHPVFLDQLHAQLLEFPKEVRNLLAGGLAGMMAKTIVAPLDRIKILYQVSNVPYEIRKIPGVVRRIIDNEGASALWKGNLATMIRVFPYSGIQFMVYDRLKARFLKRHEQGHYYAMDLRPETQHDAATSDNNTTNTQHHQHHSMKFGLTPLESLLAGMTAGTISVMCTYPLDLTRAQLAVLRKHKQHKHSLLLHEGPSKTFWSVLTDNYKLRGWTGLFRGMTPTLLGILPYSGIAFSLNEQAKREIHHVTGRDLTTIERMVCGAFAGLVAQTVTYPIEMTRRRMQTLGVVAGNDTAFGNLGAAVATTSTTTTSATTTTPPVPQQPPNLSSTIRTLYQQHGVRGFFKGVTMNWMKGPIAFSISFTTYDSVQSFFMSEQELAARLPLRKRLTMAPVHTTTTNNNTNSSSPGNAKHSNHNHGETKRPSN